ncbi:general transcription factor 3C polypeptide 3 (transcription factor C subunit 4) [Coccidioides immitis RS]|uniref:General transcription factor 3C polypeptide 3 (Transcription factor C subunit 4) n=3 Tax=Coccidioides immitis TaxID=5501 RepID=J3KEF8_COCIM|nr:general transcription factor 3C polypeptide 3 (transcription factor C subunit 4) [Coccidioides immitis RS]EAS33872.3 general transcription factor 3C polypeptide 3 (transcription factor C subunit 4) [Coccidioides immitis RS]KMP05066.1 transcription factor tfiiic complex subunit sfc4 [Coccidioides immitis RMSCC 2394]TPX21484.1 transcription factor TFIIIC subunit tfc4 [Coccidioides immitis]
MDEDSVSDRSESEEPGYSNEYDEFGRVKRRKLFDPDDFDSDDADLQQPSSDESSDAEPYEANQFIDDEAVFSSINRMDRRHRRQHDSDSFGGRPGKGVKRGPRKPLEPSAEFKELHSAATSAFIDSDYDRAIVLVKQAIQINPEMFAAHSLLSEIFLAQGQKDKALAALFSGAHTRPKDPTVWLKVAKMILDHAGDDRTAALQDVIYCYSRVIDVDAANYDVRFERAAMYRELGHKGKAAQEYERLLKDLPHNTRALRHLAETYIDINEVSKAMSRYDESITYYSSLSPQEATDFDWSDVNIYVELFGYQRNYWEGLRALRSLSRWLLGRKDDVEWDSIWEDDREWDAEDYPRRISTPWFSPSRYPVESYGVGLPLELRIKLGIYRLKMGPEFKDEAMSHFVWLAPEETAPGSRLYDYGDLFRETADALKEAKFYPEALLFYTPLQYTQEFADTSLFMAMADCHLACKNDSDAESCLLTVVEYDQTNIDARVKLAKFYESMGMMEQALKYVTEAVELGRQESVPMRRRRGNFGARIEQLAKEFRSMESGISDHGEMELEPPRSPDHMNGPISFTGPAPIPSSKEVRPEDRIASAIQNAEHVRYLYKKSLELRPSMRIGEEDATEDWLDIVDALLRSFRSNRVFFPLQKGMMFVGYSKEAHRKAGRLKGPDIMDEVQELAARIQAALGTAEFDPDSIPMDYHGISFDAWLDLFLEYALVLAGQGHAEEAYDSLAAAADANIWYHSKPCTRRIYVCWFTCAIRLQDEDVLASIARWFMKEYQFVTDTYRLFATLSRVCGDPRKSLFHSSPSMKFMLRQVKAIDYSITEDPSSTTTDPRPTFFAERASLTTKDESGNLIPAEDMDVSLLVLYGHILYAGNSFTNALNYFLRAYALDPENPAVLLSIGLSYIHHSLKRQSDNRHYLIMQGLSFMQEYRRVRENSSVPQERQEVEFNFARVWHMLGLAHLAVRGYERCLELSGEIQAEKQKEQLQKVDDKNGDGACAEDYAREAAYALQCLYSLGGEVEMAKKITEKWLVI